MICYSFYIKLSGIKEGKRNVFLPIRKHIWHVLQVETEDLEVVCARNVKTLRVLEFIEKTSLMTSLLLTGF